MRERLVPPLAWPVTISEQQLGLDLVEIAVSGIRIDGDVVNSLTRLESLNGLQVFSSAGDGIQLFNKPRRRSSQRPLIANVRTQTTNCLAPVFSGRLIASAGSTLSDNEVGSRECVKIKLSLLLNVPRFISAQNVEVVRNRTGVRVQLPLSLAGNRSVQIEDDEVSFGGDGNVLMGNRKLYRYAASKQSAAHLGDLLNAVIETLAAWLRHCFAEGNNEVVCYPRYTLSKVEWHAEFSTHDPRRQVSRFAPFLLRQGKLGNVFKRRLTGQVRTFGKHSHAMQIEFAKGIKQTTYGKTNRRIRFEMKYARNCFHRLIGRRTHLGEDNLLDALNTFRRHALTQLQSTLNALYAGLQPVSNHPTHRDLTLCIGHFTDHLAHSEEIQRSLRDTGRIVVENGSILRPSIDALVAVGVLRFERHAVYTVTDEFEAGLREMMTEPGAAMERETRI